MIIATQNGWIRDGNSTLTTGSPTGSADPAGNVTGIYAETRHVVKNGRTVRQLAFYCSRPSPVGTFKGIEVWREEPDLSSTPQLAADGSMAWNGTNKLADSGWKPIAGPRVPYIQDGTWLIIDDLEPVTAPTVGRLYINSFNTDDVSNALVRANAGSPTPSITYTITVPNPSFGEGFEYAPNAASFAPSGAVQYTYDQGGNVFWRRSFNVTNPVGDPRYDRLSSYDLMVQYPDLTIVLDSRWPKSKGTITTQGTYSVPQGQTTFACWLVSVDPDGYQNNVVENVTPRVIFTVQRPTGGGGTENAPIIQVIAALWTRQFSTDGVEQFAFIGTWKVPDLAFDPRLTKIKIVAENESTHDRVTLAIEDVNRGGFQTDFWTLYDATWTLWFVSVDSAGRENTIVNGVTPKVTGIHVTPLGTGGLKASRLDPATFNTDEFTFDVDGKWTDNVKSVDKLKVGSILKVGGGPTQKAGQIGVFDNSDVLVAWAGKQSNGIGGFWHGIWGQNAWFGGTSPANAPIQCGAGGVSLLNVTLTLSGTFGTVTLDATSGFTSTSTSGATVKISGNQIQIKDASNREFFANPNFLQINGAGGSNVFLVNEAAGSNPISMKVGGSLRNIFIDGAGFLKGF